MFIKQLFYKSFFSILFLFNLVFADQSNILNPENLADFEKKVYHELVVLHAKMQLPHGFTPNTLIKTPSGYQEIGALKVGDQIISVTVEETLEPCKICRIQKFTTDKIVIVEISKNCKIVTNDTQPFRTKGLIKWRLADDLYAQDLLQNLQGKTFEINDIVFLDEAVELIAIEIEQNHRFCITDHDLVVHNAVFETAAGGYAFKFMAKVAVVAVAVAVKDYFDDCNEEEEEEIDRQINEEIQRLLNEQNDAENSGKPKSQDNSVEKNSLNSQDLSAMMADHEFKRSLVEARRRRERGDTKEAFCAKSLYLIYKDYQNYKKTNAKDKKYDYYIESVIDRTGNRLEPYMEKAEGGLNWFFKHADRFVKSGLQTIGRATGLIGPDEPDQTPPPVPPPVPPAPNIEPSEKTLDTKITPPEITPDKPTGCGEAFPPDSTKPEIGCGAPPKDDPINNRPAGCGEIASASDKQDQIGCILKPVKLPEMENPVKGCCSVEDPSIKNLFDSKNTPRNVKSEKDEREKDSRHRENIVKAENMDKVVENTELGEKLREGKAEEDKASSRKAGRKTYKLTKKVELKDGTKLKRDDRFYIDEAHGGDHVEWFRGKSGKGVLNLDGTINQRKTDIVLRENRTFPGE